MYSPFFTSNLNWSHIKRRSITQASSFQDFLIELDMKPHMHLVKISILSLNNSDESEPSLLEPWLELKDFQLGSAWLMTFFTSARNQKLAENEPKFDSQLKTYF
jgi:hypothetical protein